MEKQPELNVMIALKQIQDEYFAKRISLIQAIAEGGEVCKEDKVLQAWIARLDPREIQVNLLEQ